MPCYDHESSYQYQQMEKQAIKDKLDQVTKLLCYSLRKIEEGTTDLFYIIAGRAINPNKIEQELLDWWTEHKRLDETERIKHLQENAKQLRSRRILAKLNEEFSEEEIEELKELI